MSTDINLQFIKEKVYDLRTAIFFSTSNSLLKLPVRIVEALTIDEEGCLWFYMKKPVQQVSEFDLIFPARLQFYKKGKSSFVEVAGRGTIVDAIGWELKEICDTAGISVPSSDDLLVNIKISNVIYKDLSARSKAKGIMAWWHDFYNWIFPETYTRRPYIPVN
ncbi:MAG TPA: hypothetical protein VIK74_07115 [Parasegetibacter sp.]